MQLYYFVLLIVFLVDINILYAQQFTEISNSLGVNHSAENLFFIGGGVGFADFNNDGWEDLYVCGGNLADKIYFNNYGNNFIEAANSGIAITSIYKTNGVTFGDINNDGYKDIFVTTGFYNEDTPNLLFLNNGDATFTNITFSAGFLNDTKWSTSATFGDFNLDGWLDLYVGSYVDSLDFEFDDDGYASEFYHIGQANSYFLNNADLTFTEYSNLYGLNNAGNTLAVTSTDYDMDFDCDIYVANDFGASTVPNCFYNNNLANNSFNCLPNGNGSDIGIFSMGIAIGDFDEDLDLDYYITNIGSNALLKNNFNNTFINAAQTSGTMDTQIDSLFSVGWGTAFLDFDNDSYLDLFVANGFIPGSSIFPTNVLNPNRFFKNNGNGTFTDVAQTANLATNEKGRGMAYADFDNDGDLDIAVNNIYANNELNRTFSFYKNENNSGNWIKFKLEGTINNRDAYGAKVFIAFNNRTLVKEVDGGSSHASKHTDIIHFGLDTVTHINNISVMWPGGAIQNFGSSAVNIQINLIEDESLYPILEPSVVINKENIMVKSAPFNSVASIANYTTNHKVCFTDFFGNEIFSTKLPGIHQLPINLLNTGTYFVIIENLDNANLVFSNLFEIP